MANQALKKDTTEKVVPFRPLTMFEEMERLFEGFAPQRWMRSLYSETSPWAETMPQVDVIDRDDHILVRATLPGVDKDDLEVSTTDHTVTIRGKTRHESREEKGEFYRCEITSGNFLRTLTLPAPVDETKTLASYRDGMLELTLPKRESAKRHTVKIETD